MRDRIYIGDFEECNICDKPFEEGGTLYDAKIIGGSWAWICLDCQKTYTMTGRMNQQESGMCIKYHYRRKGE